MTAPASRGLLIIDTAYTGSILSLGNIGIFSESHKLVLHLYCTSVRCIAQPKSDFV